MARRNLNDLLSFVTVAREGSFTRAAAQLGVTQPALSRDFRAGRANANPPADADHPQCVPDGGRGTPVAIGGPSY